MTKYGRLRAKLDGVVPRNWWQCSECHRVTIDLENVFCHHADQFDRVTFIFDEAIGDLGAVKRNEY